MKNYFLFILMYLFTTTAFANCSWMVFGGEFPLTSEPHVILCKKEFVIGYSTNKKTLLWVAMLLDPEKITMPNAVESLSFKIDPTIDKDKQAALSDYAGSGFDRGHMAPFEDVNHDREAAVESMYLTNTLPQHLSSNRGIWRVLEKNTREAALEGKLFIISGPIFEGNIETMGENKIPVPTKVFKIIIDPRTKTSTTYILPNASIPSSDLPKFIFTREEVKRQTNIEMVPSTILVDKK